MICQICGEGFVTDGVTVEDGPRRLRVSAAGIVAEVVKDHELPEPERDEQAWQAAGTAIARELRAHHQAGRVGAKDGCTFKKGVVVIHR